MVRLGKLEEGDSDTQGKEVSQAQEPERMRRREDKNNGEDKVEGGVFGEHKMPSGAWEPVGQAPPNKPGFWWRMFGKLRPTTCTAGQSQATKL